MRTSTILLSLLGAGIILVSSNQIILSNSASAPFGNTGSPGDNHNTCSRPACHNNTVNSGPGTISIDLSDIPTVGYTPGRTYQIGVDVSESGRMTYGFLLTAENNNGSKEGSYKGNSKVNVTFKDWVTHKNTSATGSWTFDWTAPQNDVPEITFYASGNAANGNGQQTGDHIYTTSKKTILSPYASVHEPLAERDVRVFYQQNTKSLKVSSNRDFTAHLLTIEGRIVTEFNVRNGENSFNLGKYNAGLYILSSRSLRFSKRISIH